MAVTFVAAGSLATNTTTATLTITAPACQADDILVAAVLNKAISSDIQPPDGTWTPITDNLSCNATGTADDHTLRLFWKRATGSGGTFDFTKDIDDNLLFCGVISAWRGALLSGSPLDATAAANSINTTVADNVTFPAFDPTGTDSHIIFTASYGNDNTTFAAAMSSDVDPDCTTRFDLETGSGTDATIACTSGDSSGANITSRTWASGSTEDSASIGVIFGLVPQSTEAPFPYIGGGYFPTEG